MNRKQSRVSIVELIRRDGRRYGGEVRLPVGRHYRNLVADDIISYPWANVSSTTQVCDNIRWDQLGGIAREALIP